MLFQDFSSVFEVQAVPRSDKEGASYADSYEAPFSRRTSVAGPPLIPTLLPRECDRCRVARGVRHIDGAAVLLVGDRHANASCREGRHRSPLSNARRARGAVLQRIDRRYREARASAAFAERYAAVRLIHAVR